MKLLLLILAIIGLIFVFSGCSKKSNSIPTLTTAAITSITDSSAASGGNITSDGGATITARGVCWSTISNPTVVLTTKTSDGTGTGIYTSSITGLLPTTTYYVKAYATNSAGTAYGSELSFTTPALTIGIGTSYGGGIIAYILQPGDPGYSSTVQHGLIAAPSNQSDSIAWWNGSFVTTGATDTAIGAGLANTNAIIAAQGAGTYAASICRSLTLGGYTDWYLPSRNELNKLYINHAAIGGFVTSFYWSSSEFNASYASGQPWFVNGLYGNLKNGASPVRAVRSF